MVLVRPEDREGKEGESGPNTAIKLKTPKRILHFSDGILEEYSDDEVDNTPQEDQIMVDPSTLTWMPWFWYKAWRAGSGTLSAIDTVGEYLASFFGITTPKYYFELEEYKRQQKEAKQEVAAKSGWSEPSSAVPVPAGIALHNITQQPTHV